MKTIIRFEGEDGIGIFKNDVLDTRKTRDLFWRIHNRHNRFNTPYEDGLDRKKSGKEWFCAYKTVEQLAKLLNREIVLELINFNFVIYELTTKEFQEGKDQFIYTKSSIISSKVITKEVLGLF